MSSIIDPALSIVPQATQTESTTPIQTSQESFLKVLESMRQLTQMDIQRSRQKADEKQAERAEEHRRDRIEELYALIAQLKAKLAASGYSPAVAAQLSAAQSELFWLLCAL